MNVPQQSCSDCLGLGFQKQKMAAIKISSCPITSRVWPVVVEMVLEVKCELENGK